MRALSGEERVRRDEQGEDLSRLLAFSDGVFAIAATLLALEIRLPALPSSAAPGEVTSAIFGLLPRVYIYVLTFANILVFWMAHRRAFSTIKRLDTRILWLNGLFLALIAFLPVPSSILGGYSGVAPTVLYASTLSATEAAIVLISAYVMSRPDLLAPGFDTREARYRLFRGVVPLGIFALSIPVAFLSTTAATLMWVSIFFVSTVLGRAYSGMLDRLAAKGGRDGG